MCPKLLEINMIKYLITSKTMSLSFSPTNSQMQRGSSLLMLPMVVRTILPPGTSSSARDLRQTVKSLLNCSKYWLNTAGGLVFAIYMFPLLSASPSLVTMPFGTYVHTFMLITCQIKLSDTILELLLFYQLNKAKKLDKLARYFCV